MYTGFAAEGFGDVERQHRAFRQVMLWLDRQENADLVGIAHLAEEGVLHLIGVSHAGDGEFAVCLLDAEHHVPTICIGEGAVECVARHGPRGFLKFDVAPFNGLERGEQVVSGRGVTRSRTELVASLPLPPAR